MKLAFFSSIVPDGNPTSGYEIANEAVVDGLRMLGHRVTVIGFRQPRQLEISDPDTHVLATMNIENALAGGWKKAEWLGRSHVKRLPISAAKFVTTSQKKLYDLIDRLGPFDGHVVNSYQMAAAFPKIMNAASIYVAHNVEHRSASENALSAESRLQRYLYRRDARLLKALEVRICHQARFIWTFSENDLIQHLVGPARGCMLPLVTPMYTSSAAALQKEYDIGLIGTWSWQPNLVGLKWFLGEVVPQLPGKLSIGVAGAVPRSISDTHRRVKFLGRVESASGFLESVRVVPLISRGGTGVQLKTIEAFQAGHACVATESSLRGVDTLPPNCVRADEPHEFSTALTSLVANSVSGELPDVDGSAFYENQKEALMAGLARGVAALA